MKDAISCRSCVLEHHMPSFCFFFSVHSLYSGVWSLLYQLSRFFYRGITNCLYIIIQPGTKAIWPYLTQQHEHRICFEVKKEQKKKNPIRKTAHRDGDHLFHFAVRNTPWDEVWMQKRRTTRKALPGEWVRLKETPAGTGILGKHALEMTSLVKSDNLPSFLVFCADLQETHTRKLVRGTCPVSEVSKITSQAGKAGGGRI